MRTAVTLASLIEHAGHHVVEEAIKPYKTYINRWFDKHPITSMLVLVFLVTVVIFGLVRRARKQRKQK
jgi:hypothetical protein